MDLGERGVRSDARVQSTPAPTSAPDSSDLARGLYFDGKTLHMCVYLLVDRCVVVPQTAVSFTLNLL